MGGKKRQDLIFVTFMGICDCVAHYFKKKEKKNTELLKELHEAGSRLWLEILGWLHTWYPKSSLYRDTQVNMILDWPHAKGGLPLASLALSPNSRVDFHQPSQKTQLPLAQLENTTNSLCLHFPYLKKMGAKQPQINDQGKILNLHFPHLKQTSWEFFDVPKTKVKHSFLPLIA